MTYTNDKDTVTLSPNSVFNLNLCEAIDLCIEKKGVAGRMCWKSIEKVAYQRGYPEGINCNKQTADTWHMGEGTLFRCLPYLQKRTVDDKYVMWQPTLEELLAKDWYVIIPCGQ